MAATKCLTQNGDRWEVWHWVKGFGISLAFLSGDCFEVQGRSKGLSIHGGLIDRPQRRPGWFTMIIPHILVCWRTVVPGVCACGACVCVSRSARAETCICVCVCVSEGDIDWSYFFFATWQMQPVHSRNVNAHTCLGGECEASLMIASVEPDWETDKVGGRTLLGCCYLLESNFFQHYKHRVKDERRLIHQSAETSVSVGIRNIHSQHMPSNGELRISLMIPLYRRQRCIVMKINITVSLYSWWKLPHTTCCVCISIQYCWFPALHHHGAICWLLILSER